MTSYRYRALDRAGVETEGVLEADSPRAARASLRERGLFPTRLDDAGQALARARGRLGPQRLALLTRQWAALLAAGLTVEQALNALIEQAERPTERAILAGVRSAVQAGYPLRAALEHHGRSFPPLYRASIAAGEKSGELARVMLQLASYLERNEALRRKTLQALLYPAIVAGVALIVVVALMTWVVPQVVEVFQHGRQQLPWLTRALIALSAALRNAGLPALVLAAATLWLARRALRDEALQRAWHARLLRLPLLGAHLRATDSARFASTLAILVGSGVPLLAALDAGRQVIARLPLRDAVARAADQVREGSPLARALGASRAFPPLLLHMIASGEATGALGAMLARAAELQQDEVEARSATLATVLEPAILLAMGALVLLIVLAVMQPIIELNTLVSQ